jgi:hypothetical protein
MGINKVIRMNHSSFSERNLHTSCNNFLSVTMKNTDYK